MAELLDRLQAALGTTYRIERELQGGGMSRVFLATEVRLNRSVVVKVLPPDMAMAVQSERFEREIQVAASLQHPHIVSLLTAGSHDDLAWYIMPFIEGESLAAKLEREGALPVHEALRILRDVLDALTYSHSRGVVHRDIKPDNVMLSGRHALVTDFGVSKAVSASSGGKGSLTTVGIALGTPTYMSPEQAAADPHVDHRADLYSVGVMAYELLTGRTPFLATTPQAMLAAHVATRPDPITQHRPSLPPMVASAVMRCLEKLPGDRWQTSTELAAVIESASTPSGGMTPVPTGAMTSFGSGAEGALRRARPVRVAALFALATVVVVAVVYGATRVFGLPDWVWIGAAVLMAAGFPIMMYTSRVERKRLRATVAGITSAEAPAHHDWFSWRRAILGGAVALGALAFAAVGYATARALGIGPAGTLLSSGVVGAEDRFVLADFQNRTADSSLGTSVTEALRVDLGQSRVVRILSDREVAGALTRMTLKSGTPLSDSLALQLAQREGAKAVIVGEVSTLGTGYVLTGKVLETATGETRASVRATAKDAGELLGALNDLSAQLRERIGESLRTIRASDPLEQVTTGSLEALQQYSLGARIFIAGDYDGAKEHLARAIAIDSTFAMAYRKLGAVLTNLNAPRSQIAAVTRKAYQSRDRLTPMERYLTEAAYYRNVEPDPDRVISAYQAVLAINPLDVTAANNIAMALNARDRSAEAEAALRPVLAKTPTRTLYLNLATALATQGKFDAIDSFSQAAARQLENPGSTPYGMMAGRFAAAREWWRADSMLKATAAIPINRGESQNRRFYEMDARAALGQHLASLRLVDAMAEEMVAAGDTGTAFDLATSHAWESLQFLGDSAGARRQMAEVLRRYPLERIPPTDRPYFNLMNFYGRLGDVEAVRRYQREYEAAVPVTERGPQDRYRLTMSDAWARRDYAAASAQMELARRASACANCWRYDQGEMWSAAGNDDSTLAALEPVVNSINTRDQTSDALYYGPALNRLGEIYEARGDKAKAREYYQRFVDLWRAADPNFQPQVAEARRRIAALGPDAPQQH